MPNSATLLQALGAAFCAILCVGFTPLSGMGGGGMMLGARTGAWAKIGGGIPTARDYVQDGLIAMWDGIENAGWGVHDPNATVWKDLVGGLVITPDTGQTLTFGINYLDVPPVIKCAITPHTNAVTFLEGVISFSPGSAEITYGFIDNFKLGWIAARANDTINFYSGGPCYEIVNDEMFAFGFDYSTDVLFRNGLIEESLGSGMSWSTHITYLNSEMYNPGRSSKIFSIRFYDRSITDAEVAANYAVDKARFNLT